MSGKAREVRRQYFMYTFSLTLYFSFPSSSPTHFLFHLQVLLKMTTATVLVIIDTDTEIRELGLSPIYNYVHDNKVP